MTLSTPANGNDPECDNYNKYGSQCLFTCKDGFGLSTASFITCTGDADSPNGEWDLEEPSCIRKEYG